MAFRIEVARIAEIDIAEAVEYIAGDSPQRAKQWFDGLIGEIESLRSMPMRYDLIPEARELNRDLRSINHYSHRIIYEVQQLKQVVYVVRVYHGARRPLTTKDIP